jgi:hypothetical protein
MGPVVLYYAVMSYKQEARVMDTTYTGRPAIDETSAQLVADLQEA